LTEKTRLGNRICPLLSIAMKTTAYCYEDKCVMWTTIRRFQSGKEVKDCLIRQLLMKLTGGFEWTEKDST